MTRSRSRRGELFIEMDGVFDVPAAKRLGTELERARPGATLRVDVSRVTGFEDFGLALLAQALGETSAARVTLRGHQLRILRYFGAPRPRVRGPYSSARLLGCRTS